MAAKKMERVAKESMSIKWGGCEEQRGVRRCLGSKEPGLLLINEAVFIPNSLPEFNVLRGTQTV
jgi:hypothetical protein